MRFRQKKGRCSTSFDFGESELTYTYEAGTKVGSTVPYHKIPGRTSYREVRLWWLNYFAVFYLSLTAITWFYYKGINDIESLYRILYFSALAFFCVCFFGFRRRSGGMTSFPLNPDMVVLHDRQHRAIMDEIAKRRNATMKTKLAQVDPGRPYYEEAGRFSWLREEDIISEQEYHDARSKIAAMRDKAIAGGAHGPLH